MTAFKRPPLQWFLMLRAMKCAEKKCLCQSPLSGCLFKKNDLLKQVRESREEQVRTKSEFTAVQAQMKELLRAHAAVGAEREQLLTSNAALQATVSLQQKVEEVLRNEAAAYRATIQAVEAERRGLEQQLDSARRALQEAHSDA